MSSVLAHIAAGATVFACSSERQASPLRPFLAACVLSAVLPDTDYFIWWVFHVNLAPRLTHSLAFSLAGSAVLWLGLRFFALRPNLRTFASLAVAASSHLILDFLVGVHPLPLLWPFTDLGFIASPGILPSAGQLRFLNPYLWRNLLIEAGVLAPIFGTIICLCHRKNLARPSLPLGIGILAVWAFFVAWSVSLNR